MSGSPAPRRASGPTVVELVGPAGAGKTSLARLLGERNPSWLIRPRPAARAHLASALAVLPRAARLQRTARRPIWMEMKRMIYLESLADLLSRPAPPGREAIVLDEGPVYFLARLRVYGADEVGRAGFAAWWPGAVARWASVLHLLVWLDAPDSVLAGRIRARSQRHRTQVLPEAEVGAFLAGYRTEYTALLEELTRQGPVDVISARTDQEPVESIARRVEVAVTRPAEAVR